MELCLEMKTSKIQSSNTDERVALLLYILENIYNSLLLLICNILVVSSSCPYFVCLSLPCSKNNLIWHCYIGYVMIQCPLLHSYGLSSGVIFTPGHRYTRTHKRVSMHPLPVPNRRKTLKKLLRKH